MRVTYLYYYFISDNNYDTNMDIAESRAINNLQNPYRGNFAGTGYRNILGSANLNGVNKFQNNMLNQINQHGNYPKATAAGFSNAMNANLKLQNQLTQQGAKMKNLKRQQSLLQIQQQNQQLQNLRLLQKQNQKEIKKKDKFNQLKGNTLSNTYTANNEQNALFNKLKSKTKNLMPSNTYRKSDLQTNKISQVKDYGFYDYDTDYYDLG